jgi:hypothetical protein
MPRTTTCMCGAVTLELSGEPAVQAFCHCESCRGWLGAPVHAASLWPKASVQITKGEGQLGTYKRTEASHRKFCQRCGTPVLIDHPALGLVDVPAGGIRGLDYQPTVHVHYGEKVMSVKDGLPKFRDMPKDFGGSGDLLAE